ncbi:hypothetical protein MA16_Dca016215 [Dendrobium catenatum]|uniref:Uncharacterized protein n=1 Tax=Dendrobium catenatum TaxID=906689 RepID=A0A2I0VVQ9_9ASPA|nr:hypothetical protein MA16_Dca016215 [Dendrobium catenatum]
MRRKPHASEARRASTKLRRKPHEKNSRRVLLELRKGGPQGEPHIQISWFFSLSLETLFINHAYDWIGTLVWKGKNFLSDMAAASDSHAGKAFDIIVAYENYRYKTSNTWYSWLFMQIGVGQRHASPSYRSNELLISRIHKEGHPWKDDILSSGKHISEEEPDKASTKECDSLESFKKPGSKKRFSAILIVNSQKRTKNQTKINKTCKRKGKRSFPEVTAAPRVAEEKLRRDGRARPRRLGSGRGEDLN